MKTFTWLLRRALISVYEDGCLSLAKGAAFSGLLAFFPVLTTVGLLLIEFRAEQAAEVISKFLFEVVPPGTEELVARRLEIGDNRPESLLVGAALVSLWAASGLMLSLVESYNAVYKVPTNRPMLRGRLVAFGLAFCFAVPAFGATAMVVLGSRTELWLVRTVGILDPTEQLAGGLLVLGFGLRYVVAFGATLITTALLFRIAPARRQRWAMVWPGAIISTVLWLASTLAFSWYVRNMANYSIWYGSIGSVIVLLIWMYLLAITSIYGCAFNAERERLHTARASLSE